MCAALYCDPVGRDFGLIWFGQRGFGGVLHDLTNREEEEEDNKTKWIPQYNLEAFKGRDIIPINIGLVEPLIKPRSRKSKFSRLPGHFSHQTPPFDLNNRNLLTAKYFKSSTDDSNGFVRIWTVNERTRRHFLEQFDVQIDRKGRLKNENVWEYMDEDGNTGWKIDDGIMELRCSSWNGLGSSNDDDTYSSVWIRTTRSLRLKKDESPEIPTIFNSSVRGFDESRVMNGEVCIVDYGGLIWMYDVAAQAASRVKCKENDELFEFVSCCDHPRMLCLATHHEAQLFDIRTASDGPACELFESAEFECRTAQDSKYIQEIATPRPKIKHVKAIPNNSNNYLIMTDHALHLVDDRFPKHSIFTLRHSIPAGGHNMIVSDSVTDEVDGGKVTSVFVLDQLITGVSTCKLYEHTSGIWSSVAPFRDVLSITDYNSTVRRGKYLDSQKIVDEPVRAISLVQGFCDKKGRKCEYLLRQTDDGAIWCQKMVDYCVSEEKVLKEQRKSCERIRKWMEERDGKDTVDPEYVELLDEKLRQDLKVKRLLIEVDGKLENKLIKKCWKRADEEGRRVGGLYFDDSSIEEKPVTKKLESMNHVLSKVVMDTWRKTEVLMKTNRENEDNL